MVNESTLVVVGYPAGFGGNFFAITLENALNSNDKEAIPINTRNEFDFETEVLGPIRYRLKYLIPIYDRKIPINKIKELYSEIQLKNLSVQDYIVKTYKEIYHPNRTVFIKNLTEYVKKDLKLKPGVNIVTAVYTTKINGFSVHDIHNKVVFLLLCAKDVKHRILLDLLVLIKHAPENSHYSDDFLVEMLLTEIKNPKLPDKPFDSCIPIEVGNLFLKYDESNALEIDKKLSEVLGVEIVLDKESIMDYCKANVVLLNDFFGLDVEKASTRDLGKRLHDKFNIPV
jgi:hypothetical protein